MSATRDLIAAALTLADLMDETIPYFHFTEELRELCARAMTAQQRASDADMQVYQAIADGYARDTQPVSAAEVPMPEPDSGCSHIDHLYLVWNEDQMRNYGDAREAAVWAKVAKALNLGTGVRFAESYLLAQIAECAALEDDLTLAYLDGEAKGYARGKAENAKDAERYRWLRDGNDRKESAAMRIALHCYGMEWDAAIDAALRGEVKP